MKATHSLMTEHEDINLMFDIVGQVYRQLETSGDIERDHLDAITEYLKGFVDKFHQPGISMM
ncbi:hypothetical protein SAMN04489760_105150 [Syntrophus gentianae]|uniref:Uncharacterized protein n=1 Tax=Syntrophus gentianae TaxID=43775 RepID=A0A1H7W4I3_9BACT|nr:hypothetical protein [Syntrophus gentianae]SEM16019.1 hypothetical protein SAMN04489760_105150 [Syntrophus gentianae]